MAESAVSSVVTKLGDLLAQEVIFLWGVPDQVKWIEKELRRMQCFLEDADSKQHGDQRVKQWVKDIRDVAHEAEDIIDVYVLAVMKRQWRRRGFKSFIRRYALIPNELVARHIGGSAIEGIKAKIREISDGRITYGINNLGEIRGEARFSKRRPILPHVDDTDVVGIENDKIKIVKQLVEHNGRRRVISIVGTGGLGKTTLARKVYNSIEVQRRFDTRIWLIVSRDYNLTELLKKILKKVEGKQEKKSGDQEEEKQEEKLEDPDLMEKLHDSLKQRRYLIVMDDVWRTDVWEQMKNVFLDEMNGSRVLITTRSWDVAKKADPATTPHELRLLDDKESLELLLKKAFANRDDQMSCGNELRDLIKEMVKLSMQVH